MIRMNATLTDETAQKVKEEIWNGGSYRMVAARYGIRPPAIQAIVRGDTWFRVPWPSGEIGPLPSHRRKELYEKREGLKRLTNEQRAQAYLEAVNGKGGVVYEDPMSMNARAIAFRIADKIRAEGRQPDRAEQNAMQKYIPNWREYIQKPEDIAKMITEEDKERYAELRAQGEKNYPTVPGIIMERPAKGFAWYDIDDPMFERTKEGQIVRASLEASLGEAQKKQLEIWRNWE